MIVMFLADGFEEIEVSVTIDILRRAEMTVRTVAVHKGDNWVTGAHGIKIKTEMLEEDVYHDKIEGVILPGGPGAINLEHSDVVKSAVMYCNEKKLPVCAICSAPMVLGHMGLLEDKIATCYPGFEHELTRATISERHFYRDGNIITANGPGAAYDFALEIVSTVKGKDVASNIRRAIQCR